ncbi:MAG: OmpA family protein [Alphaproteobacteria bacterium]|jgi:outer membrane protein OmpA-like peptidoglycan-associated protein|nr:OmpA family protein [Candidatus Jidaibacter sp.]
MLTNNLKLLAGISAILLLTSCSKVTAWFSSSEQPKPDTYVEEVSEAELSDVQDVADTQKQKMWAQHDQILNAHAKKHARHNHHNDNIAPRKIISNQQIPGQSCNCVDVMYNSVADKEQTLGVLRPGYVVPKPQYDYVQHEEPKKKVVKKKKMKKVAKKQVEKHDQLSHVPNSIVETPVMPSPVQKDSTTLAPLAAQQPAPAPAPEPQIAPKIEAPAPDASAPTKPEQPEPLPKLTPATPSEAPKLEMPTATTVAPVAPAVPQMDSKVEAPSAPAQPTGNVVFGRITDLSFAESELQLTATHTALLDKIIEDLKQHPAKHIKIQSYAFSSSTNASEARRNSYQRAIAVRKYLIDRDILATRISVNAFEDVNNKSNKIELTLEDTKQ